MKKVIVFLTLAVALLLIGLFFLIFQPQFMRTTNKQIQKKAITPSSLTSPTMFKPFTAEFKIITDGLTRDFTNARYHKQSPDVYIEAVKPHIVHVQKENITWGDFFSTLPMKITDYCLTTGTNQVFCTGSNGELRFYLNEIETPKALEMRISPGDSLIVEYATFETTDSQASSTSSATISP